MSATAQNRPAHQQFYMIVYTQTDADVQLYHCGGGLDLGLTELGIEEAKKIARRFKKNPLKIKTMIASPELRAIQMADVLHDEMKSKLSLWREFADQFLGEWEGKPLEVSNGSKDSGLEPPRGETRAGFQARVEQGFKRLLAELSTHKGATLLVIHPRVAKAIFELVGLGKEKVERGKLYALDLPEGQGIAHFREV